APSPAVRAALLAPWRRLAAAFGLARLLRASAAAEPAEPADAGGQGAPAHAYLTRDAVRAWLRQSLPDYMIPDQVHFLPAIALTDSGKVDARNLPVIEVDEQPGRQAAGTALQRELADLWARLLQVGQIGVTDDFFVLGGQSLKAIEMVAEVGRRYGVKIQLRQFYENPTIRYLETLLTERA
ncbi:phosphopantetheine-binding protein, partial [Burkholderia pseudomallei]|uniref:phosphopantetheine-binding protein n=1 Tax=Burkholderia pseudomallei TaxID=28450 RepID=UPI0021803476